MNSYGPSGHIVGACDCRRCAGLNGVKDGVPFEPGNEMAVSHGALVSATRLAQDPATIALADDIRASMPSYVESDEVTIELLAITMRRVERATAAIEVADSTIGERPLAAHRLKGPEL